MNARHLILAAALVIIGGTLAACGRDAVTGTGQRSVDPADARFDGGVTHGSGNRGSDSTTTTNTSGTVTGESGVTHGSGN